MKNSLVLAVIVTAFLWVTVPSMAPAQDLSKRLILKDGSYQLATKWEVNGNRVRYYSAEREDWEEVPNDMVDWAATDKWAADRAKGVPSPGAAEVDKEYAAEKKAEEERTPHVAPGLRLPEDGGVALLDTYKGQPQLIALDQNGGELNKNTKSNMLRAAINPIASAKETIELPGRNAKVQAHVAMPSIYINVEQQNQLDRELDAQQPEKPISAGKEKEAGDVSADRFKLVRVEQKGGKRVVGNLKVAVYGKVSQETKLVPTTMQQLTGGWVKITPSAALTTGEYAMVEYLGKQGLNLAVWDFGVNPASPENQSAWRPDPTQFNSQDQQPVQLEQREPQ